MFGIGGDHQHERLHLSDAVLLIESELDVPKHLARRVHDFYFEPQYEEFRARTLWSLSNAFTSAFKELDPIPQFMSMLLDPSRLQQVAGLQGGKGTVQYRRALPSICGMRRTTFR